MGKVSELWRRVGMLVRRGKFERELEEEMRLHRELKEREFIAEGVEEQEARYAANRQFGNATYLRERSSESWGWKWLEDFVQDVRFGVRMLRQNPAFTVVAVATLALGIGATGSIFSVVEAVLLGRLPYRNPSRLLSLYEDRSSTGFHRRQFTPANFADCKAQTAIFADIAAIDADRFYNIAVNGGTPERLSAEGVTHNLFSILGVQPLVGRVFQPEEDAAGSEHVVLLSYRLWLSRFGGDRN